MGIDRLPKHSDFLFIPLENLARVQNRNIFSQPGLKFALARIRNTKTNETGSFASSPEKLQKANYQKVQVRSSGRF